MDDLNQAERVELRAKLEELQKTLEGEFAASSSDAKPVDLELSIGRVSRADAMQHQPMALARRDRVEIRMQQVRSALSRLEAGHYGFWLRCEEPIGLARLRARPESPLRRDCQAKSGA